MAQDAMRMNLKDAVHSIGNALVALADTGPEGSFQLATFPVPDRLDILEGRAAMTVRFDGIAADDWNKYQEMLEPPQSPSDLRFEVRIYHPDTAPAEVGTDVDGYVYAQERVLEATSDFYAALRRDNTLNGLVMDVLLLGSIAGELIDPRARREYYGHEIILVTSSY